MFTLAAPAERNTAQHRATQHHLQASSPGVQRFPSFLRYHDEVVPPHEPHPKPAPRPGDPPAGILVHHKTRVVDRTGVRRRGRFLTTRGVKEKGGQGERKREDTHPGTRGQSHFLFPPTNQKRLKYSTKNSFLCFFQNLELVRVRGVVFPPLGGQYFDDFTPVTRKGEHVSVLSITCCATRQTRDTQERHLFQGSAPMQTTHRE